MASTLAIILKGYPRLSETFISQEILALEQRGFNIFLFSLRKPTDATHHPITDEIKAAVNYLPEYLKNDIPRVFRAWKNVSTLPGYRDAVRAFRKDFKRDLSANRIRRFGQALVLAHEMPASVNHYYVHFIHTPASVTYYASLINKQSWSVSAHAKDIWTIPDWEIRTKLASAKWAVTCTASNVSHLATLAPDKKRVTLLYHGLDFNRFPENPLPPSKRDGSDLHDPVKILSVGRAVDKKGYDYLLTALANLPPRLHWRFIHIGGGELLDNLKSLAKKLNIEKNIEWRGGQPQTEVLAQYRQADLFVLPSKISSNGDRDGLPNVLMEAQSQCLACLSTEISGIPEIIEHEKTGWLIAQKDIEALSSALHKLITDPDKRHDMARTGFTRIKQDFSLERGIDLLAQKLTDSCAE